VFITAQGRNEGSAIPRAPSHYGAAKSLRGTPKSPISVASTFFNIEHLLPKELSFKHAWGCQTCSLPRAPNNFITPLQLHYGLPQSTAEFERNFFHLNNNKNKPSDFVVVCTLQADCRREM